MDNTWLISGRRPAPSAPSHLTAPLPANRVFKIENFEKFYLLIHRHVAFISPAVQKLHFQVILALINTPGGFPSATAAGRFKDLCSIGHLHFYTSSTWQELLTVAIWAPPPLNWSPGLMNIPTDTHLQIHIRLPVHTSSSASLRRAASCVCSCFIHNQQANLIMEGRQGPSQTHSCANSKLGPPKCDI